MFFFTPWLRPAGQVTAVSLALVGFGVIAPAKLPKPVLDRIHAGLVQALRDPDVMQALRSQLMDVVANSPEEFARLMQEELKRWKPVVEKAAISID